MQNPAENLVCALTRMKALEPETCRKSEAENWEFSGYGGWINIGHPESGLLKALAGSLLPNKVLAKGWGASLRVGRYKPGYRELSLGRAWTNDAEMFVGVPEDSEIRITIWDWDGLVQGPVLTELSGKREHFGQLFIWSYVVALESHLNVHSGSLD